jgi:Fur family peroxide stress response transcriptional regulator
MRRDAEDLSPREVEHFRGACRKAGIKLTPQRLAIFGAVSRSRSHPTAEATWRELRQAMPSLSLDTVYRTLDTLDRIGMVIRVPGSEGSAHFDGNPSAHHHLVCRQCGAIEDIDWPQIESAELPPKVKGWGQVERTHVQFRGICRRCLAKATRSSTS